MYHFRSVCLPFTLSERAGGRRGKGMKRGIKDVASFLTRAVDWQIKSIVLLQSDSETISVGGQSVPPGGD